MRQRIPASPIGGSGRNGKGEKSMKDVISVIIPVYNAEKTLSKCLNSLLEQPHDSVEIILVNDGSTDSSDEVCKKYALLHPEIKYLKKEWKFYYKK